MLPKGWKRQTVADICRMQNGNGFGPEDWGTEGYPIIRIQNLNGGNSFDYYSGRVDTRWLVEPGQLLFAWAGTKGVSFGPTRWKGQTGVLNQHIFKVHCQDGIDEGWLYWALRHITDRIEANAHGFKATLVHVKKSDIDRQEILVPCLSTQRWIAHTLQVWDDAATVAEKLLANSRKQKAALTYDLLMGRARCAGFATNSDWVATRIGRLPSDWKHIPISEIASDVSIKNNNNEVLPVLSCTKHHGLVDSLSYFNKRVFSENTSTYKIVPRRAFVYATNHIDEGSIGHQDLYGKALISPMYTVFQVNEQVDHGFLFKLLKTEHYRQVFAANTNASVDRRGSLRWNEFKRIEIPVPTLEEQLAISEVLNAADQEIKHVQSQLDALKTERRALIADLLTGKRRAPLPSCDAEPEAA